MSNEYFDIAGKVFVLGEYAVLGGLPALVAGVAPRFAGSLRETAAEGGDYHPESPLGRFLHWAMEHRGVSYSFHFEDPYQSGGLGASTAQFAIAHTAGAERLGLNCDWRSVWRFYRDLTVSDGIAPSGADLVAQLRGGVTLFDPASPTCTDLWAGFDWSRLLIFAPDAQLDRKVATHAHLKALSDERETAWRPRLFSRLERPLMKGLDAIARRNVRAFGQALNDYAEVLSDSGLEIRRTLEDRRALADLPGVCGAKGSGALQADIVLALIYPDADADMVVRLAQTRALKLICRGLTWQAGIARRDRRQIHD
jgi:mevalonate kinase